MSIEKGLWHGFLRLLGFASGKIPRIQNTISDMLPI